MPISINNAPYPPYLQRTVTVESLEAGRVLAGNPRLRVGDTILVCTTPDLSYFSDRYVYDALSGQGQQNAAQGLQGGANAQQGAQNSQNAALAPEFSTYVDSVPQGHWNTWRADTWSMSPEIQAQARMVSERLRSFDAMRPALQGRKLPREEIEPLPLPG
jgi:hypothetical protein